MVRLAAGRARALGEPTRGTTSPNRLRRMDRWIGERCGGLLRSVAEPLVVDLGYGASPVTTVELARRLRTLVPDLRVLGLEIDPARVAAAADAVDAPHLDFARGGFEFAGRRPLLVRAANVLRQCDEAAGRRAWHTMRSGLADGGLLVEGTCDELGRLGSWVLLDRNGPVSLTIACRLASLTTPSDVAARLPKALIHHNVPGQPVHALLADLDAAWASAAPLAPFGPRQRWLSTCAKVATAWPVLDTPRQWRRGEVTLAWSAVEPVGADQLSTSL